MAMQELPPERRAPSGGQRGIVDKAWDLQHRLEGRAKNVGRGKYGRVLKMARKPDAEEFNQVAKVTAVGMLVIGGIGFLIFAVMEYVLHI
jgi:protein transport protein SEC61 subunit gamma-like protein